MLRFENRYFNLDRPREIRIEYLNIVLKRTQRGNFLKMLKKLSYNVNAGTFKDAETFSYHVNVFS